MNLTEQLKSHEGLSLKVYLCPKGKKTIGYGYNIESNMLNIPDDLIASYERNGISKTEAEILLTRCISECRKTLLTRVEGFNSLDSTRQDTLINLCFNMGISRLMEFKQMLRAVREGDFKTAADEMKDSKWYHQVGLRSKILVEQMRTGRYA